MARTDEFTIARAAMIGAETAADDIVRSVRGTELADAADEMLLDGVRLATVALAAGTDHVGAYRGAELAYRSVYESVFELITAVDAA
jgi:hypothetical protein